MARAFWIKRKDWIIGPIHERQFDNMIQQRWFRETDEFKQSENAPWQPVGNVVPAASISELPPEELFDEDDDHEPVDDQFESRDQRREAPQDAPQWFQQWRRNHAPASRQRQVPSREVDDDRFAEPVDVEPEQSSRPAPSRSSSPDDDFRFMTAEIDNTEFLAQDRARIHGGLRPANDTQPEAEPEDFGSPRSPSSLRPESPAPNRRSSERYSERLSDRDDEFDDTPKEAGRSIGPPREDARTKRTSSLLKNGYREGEAPAEPRNTDDFPGADGSAGASPSLFQQAARRRGADRRKNSTDDSDDEQPVEEQSKSKSRRSPASNSNAKPPVLDVALQSEFELDVESMRAATRDGQRQHLAAQPDETWIAHDRDVPDEDDTARREMESRRQLKLRHTDAVDFDMAAKLAAYDPAVSTPDLPASVAPLMSDAERGIRRSVADGGYLEAVRWLLAVLGFQVCAISMVANGWCFVAFKRLFILSMEVFIPFGQGSGEVLLETDLMFCGIAMACTAALPVLPWTYLVKMDGRVVQYLASLGAAFVAAAILHGGGVNEISGIVAAILLFAVPSVVLAGLAIKLAIGSQDQGTRKLLYGVAAGSIGAAAAFGASSPSYGFNNLIREFPPSVQIFGPWSYLALMGYATQLSLVYLIMHRWAKNLCDASTLEFIVQHVVFHVALTVTAFVCLVSVQTQMLHGWASIPASLTSLIATVSLGFNLWSMASHVEPYLGRVR